MSPFLNDDENDGEDGNDDYEFESDPRLHGVNGKDRLQSSYFRDEKKFLIIGGVASVVVFFSVAYFLYFGSKPIDLDELPIIKADSAPIKIKPQNNDQQVSHQDKVVYDNISEDKRFSNIVEKAAPPPEEILSIPEMDSGESLSNEEKKNIIQAFDEVAPEKQYKINYISEQAPPQTHVTTRPMDSDELSPIRYVEGNDVTQGRVNKSNDNVSNNVNNVAGAGNDSNINEMDSSANHHGLRDLMTSRSGNKIKNDGANEPPFSTGEASSGDSIMVQIASVHSRAAAEAEYNRIAGKNEFLKRLGKKIVKVDLGEKKGIRYRIQVGPFRNRYAAQEVVSSLRNNGFASYVSQYIYGDKKGTNDKKETKLNKNNKKK